MAKKSNMFGLSAGQRNPFVGCGHDCIYCEDTFKRQTKRRGKKNCPLCYYFEAHAHPERLKQGLPKTKYMQFLFICCNGDIAFCRDTEYFHKIISWIQSNRDRTFLLQSKDPKTFNRIAAFPENLILGTTLETNRDALYEGTSKAPRPSQRYRDFLEVKHDLKMVTMEPIIDFDIDVMLSWLENINPCMVWLGYDSRKHHLPEPKLEKVKNLYWELGSRGFTVILKTIRKAWYENESPKAKQKL